MRTLASLLDGVPSELRREVFTHASWTERRAEAYDRLAFLGDSVLGLAITDHLYPRLDPTRYGAGRLTKIRAHVVSGRACKAVALRLDVPARLREAAARQGRQNVDELVQTERVLGSVIEAVIGAVYLVNGYEATAAAVVEAFTPEIELALERSVDYKSELQERLARRGDIVAYSIAAEEGPPHARVFEVVAEVGGTAVGTGRGRSKKDAEQAAARTALEAMGA